MSFEPATDRLGYRWGKWKVITGVSNDGRRTLEPKSNWEWIGSGMHDWVAESIMHFQHWANEDASGSLDETVREVFSLIQENYRWAWSFIAHGGRQEPEVLLFDLSTDRYEDRNVASENPHIVKEMLARVDKMKTHFPPNCDVRPHHTLVPPETPNPKQSLTPPHPTLPHHSRSLRFALIAPQWMLMDMKIEYESVTYLDSKTGLNVTKLYHSPWVPDDEYDSYVPHLFALNHLRKIGCSALAFLEALLIAFLGFKCCKKIVTAAIAGTTKAKQE